MSDLNIDLEDRQGETPLSLATKEGHEFIVQLLLDVAWVDVE
jgi:ankyrin repeat protein